MILLGLLVGFGLAACDEGGELAQAPAPQEPGANAIGYYCGMAVAEHEGPKGHIFIEGRPIAIWFSSVRDTLAFTMLPEEPKKLAAIYVNDMGRSENWSPPEPGTWILAQDALFVAGSTAMDGMGAREIVPFGDRAAAERFRGAHGGEIFRFGEVPQAFVLGNSDGLAAAPTTSTPGTQYARKPLR
jgi:copper chaperone NosL